MVRMVLLITLVLGPVFWRDCFCQEAKATQPQPAQQFPAIFQKSVTAGKTAPGTKVQAKLAMATLLNGTVVPRNATLSGEIVESVAKSRTDASRLSIRIDSVIWKNGSAPLQLYLTALFYPAVTESGQDLQYGPQQPASRTWNGAGEYPDPNTRSYKPFPDAQSNKDQPIPDTPNPVTSKTPLRMKDVDVENGNANGLVLVSKRSNLKLDRFTTYVFTAGEMLPKK